MRQISKSKMLITCLCYLCHKRLYQGLYKIKGCELSQVNHWHWTFQGVDCGVHPSHEDIGSNGCDNNKGDTVINGGNDINGVPLRHDN